MLISNAENKGFTGGMNIGLGAASGDYIYLTEDDIRLERDCIQHLIQYAGANAHAGLMSPVMCSEGSGMVICAGGEVTLSGIYRNKLNGEGSLDHEQFTKPFNVTYIPGASMFAAKSFWRDVKGFRAEFFMYGEDVELCLRAVKAGYEITVLPQSKIYQFVPSTTETGPVISFHKLKNLFALYVLHAPYSVWPEFLFRYGLLGLLRTLKGGPKEMRRFLSAWLWVTRSAPSLLADRLLSRHDSSTRSRIADQDLLQETTRLGV
jgi:GT2 family glycosyltransferase